MKRKVYKVPLGYMANNIFGQFQNIKKELRGNKMIDELVEKYESRIKYHSAKDAIRGFLMAIDLPCLLVEIMLRGGAKALNNPPTSNKCYTLGFKNYVYWAKDHKNYEHYTGLRKLKSELPWMASNLFGFGVSLCTQFIPWAIAGAVNLIDFYARRTTRKD